MYRSSTTTSPYGSRCRTCCAQFGFAAEAFSSAEAFLASDAITETSCLILDVAMPGMSGPELQQELIRRRQDIPIVFITAGDDESVRPHLLAQGAVECLFKPLSKTAAARRTQRRASSEVEYDDDVHRERRAARRILCPRRPQAARSRSLPCRTSRLLCSSLTTTSPCASRWRGSSGPQGGSPRPSPHRRNSCPALALAVPCCLVLDVTLPGLNGLELQQQLAERTDMPIVFITGHGTVPMSVQAMKAGAVEFLTKPFKKDVLLDAIRGALERSRLALRLDSEMRVLRMRYESLTPRERQVMALVVSGLLNKQVGGELGISEITVKKHRGRMMEKMKADSLPDLVTMAARLGRAVYSQLLTRSADHVSSRRHPNHRTVEDGRWHVPNDVVARTRQVIRRTV